MTRWAVVLADVLSGETLAELPYTSGKWTDALNAPGAATVEVPLDRVNVVPRVGRHGLWILRDGTPLWSGMVWSRHTDPSDGGRTLTVVANGWLSYFRRRTIRTTISHTTVDQSTIARGLIDTAQAVTGGNIGVATPGTTLSGILRTRTWPADERKTYGDALEELAALDDGFDFRFAPTLTGTTLGVDFHVEYPAGGRTTGLVFDHGANVTVTAVDTSADDLANHVDISGNGQPPVYGSATDTDSIGVSYPLLEHVGPRLDIADTGILDAHAARELGRRKRPTITATVVKRADAAPALGSYLIGDRFRLRYADPVDDLDAQVRVLARSVSLADDDDLVELTLGPLDPTPPADLASDRATTNRRLSELERARTT